MASTIQSALHPAGIQAARIDHLWWLMFTVCAVVWIAVAGGALIAVWRGRRGANAEASPRTIARSVGTALAISVVALLVLLTASVVTGRAVGSLRRSDALRVKVTGYQWWWAVQYLNPNPSKLVTTANELHIPVGRPVGIELAAGDVIHSLWIPSLQGKRDLIPGRQTEVWIEADRPGVYRGQCAEFCGAQHAHMALVVVAEPESRFQGWLDAQREPAPAPTTASAQRGLEVFESGPCAMCHSIEGTSAGGHTAPDLTHVASRSTLAAGTLPNTRGYLAGWITDPQHIKAGSNMPATGVSPEDLQSLLDYLETLR